MKGRGFYIWQLKDLLPVKSLLDLLKQAEASWVCIKFADGINNMNQIGPDGKYIGNDSFLKNVVQELKDNDYEVGGWHFIYPSNAGAQAGVAGDRFQKFDLAHWLVDAENLSTSAVSAPWFSHPDRAKAARVYMGQIRAAGIPLSAQVGLSTYRFPTLQPPFPFSQFVNADSSNLVAPQVYWVGAHNPREQVIRSMHEYNNIHALSDAYPFIPMGASFGDFINVDGKKTWWEASPQDIREFESTVQELSLDAWGYWSLDWIKIKDRQDYIQAMTGTIVVPPPPPPPDPIINTIEVTAATVNVRSDAGVEYPILATTKKGARWGVEQSKKDQNGKLWYQLGKTAYIASWLCKPIF